MIQVGKNLPLFSHATEDEYRELFSSLRESAMPSSAYQVLTVLSMLLALFAVTTALLLTGTFLLTKERIAGEVRKAEEKALLEIVPRERHDNSMLDETITVDAAAVGLSLREDRRIYIARQGSDIVAAIVPVTAPDGYSGEIDLIVGVNADGTVAGVRTLAHKETPGLGGEVDNPKWKALWPGRRAFGDDLEPKIEVIKGLAGPPDAGPYRVDGLSGATISWPSTLACAMASRISTPGITGWLGK